MAAFGAVPGLVIAAPMNEPELRDLMYTALRSGHPFMIRYPRGCGEGLPWRGEAFRELPVGRGRRLRDGSDVALVTVGTAGNAAARAAERAAEAGVSVAHYDLRFVKPLDEALLDEAGRRFRRVVTVEDGCLRGGVGEAVAAFFNAGGYDVRVRSLGIGDEWVEHGTPAQLQALCGYDEEAVLGRCSRRPGSDATPFRHGFCGAFRKKFAEYENRDYLSARGADGGRGDLRHEPFGADRLGAGLVVRSRTLSGDVVRNRPLRQPFRAGTAGGACRIPASAPGRIEVVNSGADASGCRREAVGRARPGCRPGQLRVSFFWIFYSDYNVLALGDDYGWALVGGGSPKYLWILSRTPSLPQETLERILKLASDRGVRHRPAPVRRSDAVTYRSVKCGSSPRLRSGSNRNPSHSNVFSPSGSAMRCRRIWRVISPRHIFA